MRGITIFVAAAAFVRLAEPAHGASHVAIIYETPEWVASVQAALTTDWTLVPWSPDLNQSVKAAAEVAIGMVPDQLLSELPNLKLYQTTGYVTPLEDRVGSPAGSIPDGVKVCRGGLGKAAAEYSRTIAEWILAASLELTFKLRATDETMRACAWKGDTDVCPPSSIFGSRPPLMNSTLGIVGYGHVGEALATLAAPLFGEIVASTPSATGPAPSPLTWWSQSNDAVLKAADVLVFSFADHINATRGLINRTSYTLVKRGAVAVLFVGGDGVDEQATYDALKDGTLSAAAINQWWSRYSWRSPRPPSAQWLPPSKIDFRQLGDKVLMAPNSCEKSTTYWAECAELVASNLDAAAVGQYPCADPKSK